MRLTILNKKIFDDEEIKYYQINNNPNDNTINLHTAIEKLGTIEDLEESLGIDLITLFKALKEGIYIKEYKQIKHLKTVILFYDIIAKQYRIKGYDNGQDYTLNNYGKTWALDRKELEDEKED